MRKILFYNVYMVNHWRELSQDLLADVPYDDIVVHCSFDLRYIFWVPYALFFFKRHPKVRSVIFSRNHAQVAESRGLIKFLKHVDLSTYGLFTYIHSKGVTKPGNEKTADWRNLMKYFVLQRHDLTEKSFASGYKLYGVNLSRYEPSLGERKHAYQFSDFWYRGTFVSVNLNLLLNKIEETPVDVSYYGVEGFWGKLCQYEEAYCAHESGVSHYEAAYPPSKYRDL